MDIAERIRSANLEVHDREARIYDRIHPEIFSRTEQQRIWRDLELIVRSLPAGEPVRALDIGCGTGNLALKLLEMGYSVRAVDISPRMIEELRARIPVEAEGRVELAVDDAQKLLSDRGCREKFKLVTISSVLHHLPDYLDAVRGAMSCLSAGGILYVCHEPLRLESDARRGVSFVEWLLRLVDTIYSYSIRLVHYTIQTLKDGRLFRRFDYTLSDYHSKEGIDPLCLLPMLEADGAECLLFETYRSHNWGLVARLDNRFRVFRPGLFRFIVRKRC